MSSEVHRPVDDDIVKMLVERALLTPHADFLRTTRRTSTYGEIEDLSARLAGALARRNIRAGTPVLVLMGNSVEQVVVWFALARLGALHVPVNTALVGDRLRHVLTVSEAKAAVVDADLVDAFESARDAAPDLDTVVVHEPDYPRDVADGRVPLGSLLDHERVESVANVDPLTPATLLFTSGTTGVSKACVLSRRYLVHQGRTHAAQFDLRADDVLYCPFPLFHIDAATLTVIAALSVGATAALGSRFSATRFWDEVRAFDASVFNFMGATLTILWKRPPLADDRQHRVRMAWGVPMPEWKSAWEQRFGFPLLQVYGLTDAGVPVYDPIDGGQREGACGRVIDSFEVRIGPVPGDHTQVADARVGEILVRGRRPGLTMSGYHQMPEQTAETIDADGWVHTGDLGYLEEGYLYFQGRLSDSIRRRGENISAFEVEEMVATHPSVLEVAAIGVPSDLTEEDVMVCVVPRAGVNLDPAELHRWCVDTAPSFMVPRYIEILVSLPKTPTQKIEKFRLRDAGVNAATWDATGA